MPPYVHQGGYPLYAPLSFRPKPHILDIPVRFCSSGEKSPFLPFFGRLGRDKAQGSLFLPLILRYLPLFPDKPELKPHYKQA